MMRRFTLIHDGSTQGWQAAYLAIHIAARLGAPLNAILTDSNTNKRNILQSADQVGVGGRAAKVAIKTHYVQDFSVDILKEMIDTVDGLFVPRRFISGYGAAKSWLENLSCPIWIVSKDAETYSMVALVSDLTRDAILINYAVSLSNRMQQSLICLVHESELENAAAANTAVTWVPLYSFSTQEITSVIDLLGINLIFIPISNLDLVDDLDMNIVIFP